MMPLNQENIYYVYISSNPSRTTVYTGFTSNLFIRIDQHINGKGSIFGHKYKCFEIIYYEQFLNVTEAIAREKYIKKLSRKNKDKLIDAMNPKRDNLLW